ncbi:RAN binding protein 3 [Homo sapiens]|uniref:RAN binding protein 3 n=1 Tax=Homo sapiens TaxID=9606 RepID=K7EJ17_HUMAN|nr:RAN binding protein 3 [Homo sapiens]KAI4039851.1 RAN binding protein 3 [Homo sapiens]
MLHCRLTSGFEGRVLSLAKVKKTGKRKSLPLLRPSLCFRRIKDKSPLQSKKTCRIRERSLGGRLRPPTMARVTPSQLASMP